MKIKLKELTWKNCYYHNLIYYYCCPTTTIWSTTTIALLPQFDLLLLLPYYHNLIYYYCCPTTTIWFTIIVALLPQFDLLLLIWSYIPIVAPYTHEIRKGEQDHNWSIITISNTKTPSPTQETMHKNKRRGLKTRWSTHLKMVLYHDDPTSLSLDIEHVPYIMQPTHKENKGGRKIAPRGALQWWQT